MTQTPPGDASALAAFFRHNAWANLTLLTFCARLTDAQLDATLVHLAVAEPDYMDLATGKRPPVSPPEDRFVGFAPPARGRAPGGRRTGQGSRRRPRRHGRPHHGNSRRF